MASVADLLSMSRLAIAPALPVAAALAPPPVTVAMIGWGMLSDAADGLIARHTHTESDRGARLDSFCDVIFYSCALAAFLIAFPEVRALHTTWVAIGASLVIPSVYGWLKFSRLPSYHTFLSRFALVLLSASLLAFAATGAVWPFHVVGAAAIASAIDDMLITRMLPSWRSDIPHVLAIARENASSTPSDGSDGK
jgi:phosphatidylglycerophosphate synthase